MESPSPRAKSLLKTLHAWTMGQPHSVNGENYIDFECSTEIIRTIAPWSTVECLRIYTHVP